VSDQIEFRNQNLNDTHKKFLRQVVELANQPEFVAIADDFTMSFRFTSCVARLKDGEELVFRPRQDDANALLVEIRPGPEHTVLRLSGDQVMSSCPCCHWNLHTGQCTGYCC